MFLDSEDELSRTFVLFQLVLSSVNDEDPVSQPTLMDVSGETDLRAAIFQLFLGLAFVVFDLPLGFSFSDLLAVERRILPGFRDVTRASVSIASTRNDRDDDDDGHTARQSWVCTHFVLVGFKPAFCR